MFPYVSVVVYFNEFVRLYIRSIYTRKSVYVLCVVNILYVYIHIHSCVCMYLYVYVLDVFCIQFYLR